MTCAKAVSYTHLDVYKRQSVPCVLSLLVSALYNIVDQIFIGNSELSALGNAATGVVFPIFIIAQAFAWCFGDGCAAYLLSLIHI